MAIREAIQRVVEGRSLSQDEAAAVMGEMMEGQATPAQIAANVPAPTQAISTTHQPGGWTKRPSRGDQKRSANTSSIATIPIRPKTRSHALAV